MRRARCAVALCAVLLGALLGGALPHPGVVAAAPAAATSGAVVALAGTPHLWIGGEDERYHWVGDSRALGQHPADWSSRREVGTADLRALPRGDPWLSTPLVRFDQPGWPDGPGAMYLPKWESTDSRPTLLHIRSIEDVQFFGITQENWGRLVKDAPAWEGAIGLAPATLPRGILPPVVAAAVVGPPPAAAPAGPVWAPAEGELAVTNRAFVTRTRDGVAWSWVPAWYEQVGHDDRLMDALVLAATHEPRFRAEVAANLAASEARIVWGDLPAGALGRYREANRTITVSPAVAGDRGGTAVVLSHEIFHAQVPMDQRQIGTPGAVAACVDEEAHAFEWQTRVWLALPDALRAASPLGEFMTPLARTWQAGSLPDLIRNSPGYRRQCALIGSL
jgi:hypothetical protein